MANILLLANINCDRILRLNKPLQTGGRFHYLDGGKRLGGGGANTGLGLVWAKHQVSLVSQVGDDEIGDWVVAQASTLGLDCRRVQRFKGNTCEMLLMIEPNGERTIIRPERPIFTLAQTIDWSMWNAFYINTSAQGADEWALDAINYAKANNHNREAASPLVVAQLAKDERARPCHVLIASITDMQGRCDKAFWSFAKHIAGEHLRYFIVTDGERGAHVYTQDKVERVAAVPTEVVDTTGAGDNYAAGVIHGLCQGLSITQAMEQGAIWASFAVASSSSIPGEQLKAYLSSNCHD